MIRFLSYILSGQGITPDKTFLIINLLRNAGVIFSPSSRYGNSGKPTGVWYFFPIEEINEQTREKIIQALTEIGIINACLERVGHYMKQ